MKIKSSSRILILPTIIDANYCVLYLVKLIASTLTVFIAVTVIPVTYRVVSYEGFSTKLPFANLMASQRGKADANLISTILGSRLL